MLRKIKAMALGAAMGICLGGPLGAETPDQVLRDLMEQGAASQDYTPSFLAQAPVGRVQEVLDQVSQLIGTPRVIEVQDGKFYIETDTHRAEGTLTLDGDGRIATLWFDAPEPIPTTMDSALGELAGLADEVSWLVLRDGQKLSALRSDKPMAVASAFKLGVLSVLQQDIKAGSRKWADVVQLEARHKSLPTGQLQNLPDGSPVTLHTAAALMISISDNTASDLLVDVLGRDRVATALGTPGMLTTREFFSLKLDPVAQSAWLAAEPDQRPDIAAQAAQNLPPLAEVPRFVPGIEWNVSLDRLCGLIAPLAELPLMQMNPGLAPRQNWARVAYKGGSEPGVINFTTALLDDVGRELCVAVTLNDGGDIDMLAAAAAYRGLLAVLR
ncbi:serine hydrolase [Tropicibacter oceani]|uniref:Serine hydrolase n=1 Tax=Tropicibacter oceani TaxID=3058420 RepID=A0ABY8QJ42_9RHOB|nr:serine hydrolase [Tropicibacter oceani]WGW04036.1 serine hydrolase [Tropicibacter oceani]